MYSRKSYAAYAMAFYAVASGALLISSSAFADSPRDFLRKALEGDNSEIMLGQFAAERGRSPRVRDFGNMLVTDHSKARDEVLQVAGQYGFHDQRDIAPEARDERRRLSRIDGHEFDREFVRYMVDDHRKDVSDFRNEAGERHGAVSELARRQLPTLQHHLEMAMDLDKLGEERDDNRNGGDQNSDRRDRPTGGTDYRSSEQNNDGNVNRDGTRNR